MVKLNFIHVCENALVDQDGKISVIGIFEKIKTDRWPAIHPKFTVVTNISGASQKYMETVGIISPNGDKIAEVKKEIEVKEEIAGANLIANFINTIFPNEGRYIIKVLIDDNNGNIIEGNSYLILKYR